MTPATGLDITINTNEAYNIVTRGEGGGGGGGGRRGGGGGRQGIQPPPQQVGGSHEDAYEVPDPPPLQPASTREGPE